MSVRIKRFGMLLLLLVVMSLLVQTSPVHAQGSRLTSVLPSQRMLNRYGLERAWWSQATIDPQRDRVRYITVDEELLYIQTRLGMVSAFENETGKLLWSALLGRPDDPSFPIALNENVALVVAGLDIFAVEKFTGKVLWKLRTPGSPSTSPTVDKKQVYLGFLDGSLYAIDLKKVRELYAERRLPAWSFQAVAWRYATGKEVTTPAITNGTVVNFASRDGSLYTVSASERELLFQFETDAPVSAPLAASKRFLFLASEDFNFYCLDRVNGRVSWEFISGLPVRIQPRIIGEQVFLMPVRGGIYCLSVKSGKQLWWRPEASEFLAATPKMIYASDRFGNVVLLSRKDGSVQGALPLQKFQVRLANDRTDRLYLATQDGLVICIHEKTREFPIYHLHPDRRPIVPEFAPEEAPQTEEANSE